MIELSTREVQLGGDVSVKLRLTTKAIGAHKLKYGKDSPPLLSLLLALEDYDARIDLLGAALQYPGHQNPIRDGGELLDALTDAGYSPEDVDKLIVNLLGDCGLIGMTDLDKYQKAARANSDRITQRLLGLLTSTPEEPAEEPDYEIVEDGEAEANPTPILLT